jgi:chemotaxis protein CheD
MKEICVRVADAAVARGDVLLSTLGLGSCIAIALYDSRARVAGLAHILLPNETLARDRENRAKFAASAVPLLLERMRAIGAKESNIVAKLAGGASMFTSLLTQGGPPIGERNLIATRIALASHGIRVMGEDVGGGHGRSVYLHGCDGRVEVRSMGKGHVVL